MPFEDGAFDHALTGETLYLGWTLLVSKKWKECLTGAATDRH
jgi:hypothetical protein